MASHDYDVIVIGSGAGGIVCARLLASAGKSVAVVEAQQLGGSSLHSACIPTKALLESAGLYHKVKHATQLGLRGDGVGFNYPSVKAWKDRVVKSTGIFETEESLHQTGITVIHGAAHFIDGQTISVGAVRFRAKQFVIATGSEPKAPQVAGLNRESFLTPKDALDLSRPPKSLLIIGGGSTGIEFASIFGSFGSKIHLVERAARLLPAEDALAGDTVQKNLHTQYGVETSLRSVVQSVAKRGMKKQVVIKQGASLKTIVVDEILIATGKQPTTDIGLENAGVAYDAAGISVNSHLKTTAKHIFAIGDVTSIEARSTHSALHQGRTAAYNILHPKKSIPADYTALPRTVFSEPEVAAVGLAPHQLRHSKLQTVSATASLDVIARSHVYPKQQGFVKLVAEKRTGRIIAGTIVAPHASELIHELTLAVHNRLDVHALANTIHAFPTWSEAIRVASSKLAKKT